MIAIVIRAATPAALLAFTAVSIATSALAQAPTEAQREAIKSQCRSDYIAHCSSIPPGGAASLECLQKNMASLSAGCAGAVRAVEAPAETKAEPRGETKAEPKEETKVEPKEEPKPAPATTTARPAAGPAPKAASAPAKQRPTSAQISAIRSACRSDYPKVCAGVPTGGAPALQCLEKNEARLSASCRKAVAAVSGGVAPSAAGGAAPATAGATPTATPAAAAPMLALRPLRPREVLFVMRSACGEDVQALCPGVAPGGGRIVECLVAQSAKLSPACRGVLDQFAQ
ncbi:MAG TPA: cysteine rich repeat-containing protein [Bradyrhizobium sp.]|nr:cysteine rich repeat-containing protein [Bradyrhizobium sp.]